MRNLENIDNKERDRVVILQNPELLTKLRVLTMSPTAYQRRSNASSSLNRSQQLKPFCKICFDTGKAESLYSNHFVRETRDPNSRIVCPTLLALECRYCFASGHTVSKCPKLKGAKSGSRTGSCDAPMKKQKNARRCCDESSCSSNGFSVLDSLDGDGDGDSECVDTVSDVFPCLAESLASVNEVSNKTYAAALMALLSKPPRKVVVEVPDDVSCVSSVSGSSMITEDLARGADLRKVFARNIKYSAPGSWANDSDSDDEE